MSKSEKSIQSEIMAAIGSMPDVLVMKNSVGLAHHLNEATGATFKVPYGLAVGSPDLILMLRVQAHAAWTPSVWVALEVKAEGGRLSKEQAHCHQIWQEWGCLVYVVRSAEAAKEALQHARKTIREWLAEEVWSVSS